MQEVPRQILMSDLGFIEDDGRPDRRNSPLNFEYRLEMRYFSKGVRGVLFLKLQMRFRIF